MGLRTPLIAGIFLLTTTATFACSGGDPSAVTTVPTLAAAATPLPTSTPEPVTTLLFTGDIIPARCAYAQMREIGDYNAAFQPLRNMLTSADITIGTLDSTLADSAMPLGCIETFNLAGPAAFADALGYAGFDVMSHAANHIKDCGNVVCGDAAVTETIANLRRNGIASAGSGATLDVARAPAIVERSGVRFAFLAYDDVAAYYNATATSAGSAPLDLVTIVDDIAHAREVADVVMVLPHWGVEYTASPTSRQREAARITAFSGADLIVGNHPHWVQAHEKIGGMFVAYGLGNFVFDQDWSVPTQQGAMLEVTFTGARLTKTRYIPIHVYDAYQPRLAGPAEATVIIDRIESASAALTP